jgi:hypothetical protein
MGMHIKVDSGWIGTAIGLAATAACVMWPSSGTAIGFILFGLAAVVLFLGIRVENSHLRWGTRRRMVTLIGVLVFGFLSCSCAIWYLWSSNGVPSTVAVQTDKPRSLLDLYKSDFSGLMKSSRDYVVELRKRADGTPDGNVNISYTACLDFVSKSKFYTFYIKNTNTSDQTAAAAEIIGVNYKNIADKLTTDVYIEAKDPADSESTAVKELIFTGRIYLYYEKEMSIAQRGWLESLFKSNGASVVFRGPDYPTTRWLQDRASAKRP